MVVQLIRWIYFNLSSNNYPNSYSVTQLNCILCSIGFNVWLGPSLSHPQKWILNHLRCCKCNLTEASDRYGIFIDPVPWGPNLQRCPRHLNFNMRATDHSWSIDQLNYIYWCVNRHAIVYFWTLNLSHFLWAKGKVATWGPTGSWEKITGVKERKTQKTPEWQRHFTHLNTKATLVLTGVPHF